MVYFQTKLRDWININKLNWDYLSSNTNAIELLKANQNKIDWKYLSANPNVIEILEKNFQYRGVFILLNSFIC